ncbi:MAG: molecular chaperone TorD family protein [Coriobacteriales bacterium]|nr:molecular chaperone TorD family protein [Coriobacteriales bacterium]
MLSRIYFKPLSEEEVETFAAMDFISLAADFEGDDLLAEGFNDMGRALKRRNTGTRQQLSTDYTMCFDGIDAIGEEVAVPYASVFLGEFALMNQEPYHKVYKLYRSESVKLKDSLRLPDDHISFELEFLALLSDRAAAALKNDEHAEVIRNFELSREFINEHILSWFDLLAERAEKLLKTRFYRGALKVTKGYLELDLQTIADLIEAYSDECTNE